MALLKFMTALMFMMQAGFAMRTAGSVRQKNVKKMMLNHILVFCSSAIGFSMVGFAFAYLRGGFALQGIDSWVFFFHQFGFAATAATIAAGTVAERCKMAAYVFYSFALTAFVYPFVARFIWYYRGFVLRVAIDLGGSGVVHITGGITALVAAIVLGPRKGRFHDGDGNPLEEPTTFPPHSVSLQVLGTFLLWVGWYGCNCGSTLKSSYVSRYYNAHAAITTTFSAASSCFSAVFTDSILKKMRTGEKTYDLTKAMNGVLSGLVAISAGCGVITPGASIIVGLVGGWFYLACSKLLIKWRIDDAADAVSVHLANGVWGMLAVGLFAHPGFISTTWLGDDWSDNEESGLFYSFRAEENGIELLGTQVVQILCIIGMVTGEMTTLFLILNKLNIFRIDPSEEEVGLDVSHHGGEANDMSGVKNDEGAELTEVAASCYDNSEVCPEVARPQVRLDLPTQPPIFNPRPPPPLRVVSAPPPPSPSSTTYFAPPPPAAPAAPAAALAPPSTTYFAAPPASINSAPATSSSHTSGSAAPVGAAAPAYYCYHDYENDHCQC